jgi:HKD family nuclease
MSSIQLITSGLGVELQEKIQRGKTIYIITSFSMKSGVELLKPSLRFSAEQESAFQILMGDYLYNTSRSPE